MRNTLVNTAAAALVVATPLFASEAIAGNKVKDIRFHFVQGAYENLPAMEMKFAGGKWNWTNKSDRFNPRLKVKYHTTRQSSARLVLTDVGDIWMTPASYYTKKYEKLVTLNIGKSVLASSKNKASALCDVFGGSRKTVRDMHLPAKLIVADQFGKGKTRNGIFPVKVVCQAKPEPTRQPVSLKLSKLKMYTIPAKPVCGKPVKMVAEFHTNKPGKVDFVYYRGDGENHKASVQTTKGGTGYSKRWAKTYTFNKTTIRKYKVVTVGHKNQTPWVNLHVRCDNTNGISG